MKLNEIQINYLLKFFPDNCAGAKDIARKLLTNGTCIVAGTKPIWSGGIGNFIKYKPVKDAFECTEYTLDIDYLLSSTWIKDHLHNDVREIKDEIAVLEASKNAISELIK